jgi:hypothetical protein
LKGSGLICIKNGGKDMDVCDSCEITRGASVCKLCDGYVNDKVEHPNHYTAGGIECIVAIKAALGDEGFRAYCKGNIIKYAWREKHKNGDEDIRKIIQYCKFILGE